MDLVKNNLNDIYYELLKSLLYESEYMSTTKKGDLINEFINISFVLKNPINCFATIRNMSFDYLKGEIEFYLSGSPFLKDIVKYAKFWENVTDDDRSVNSNYGKLLLHDRNLHNYTQFEYAKDMLLKNSDSKKAVMTIYSKENAFKSNDNPCTMYLQFFIRDFKLNLFVKMRSSDIWFGIPYDVPFFVLIQNKMLIEYNQEIKDYKIMLGNYFHQAGSLHLYQRNFVSARNIINTNTDVIFTHQKDLFNEYIIKPLLQK